MVYLVSWEHSAKLVKSEFESELEIFYTQT